MRAKLINEKFNQYSDPVKDLKIGIISKITSEDLSFLYGYSEDEIKEMRDELGNDTVEQILTAMELEDKGIIETGNYFDYLDEHHELLDYIEKYAEGRYVYDGSPHDDGTWVIFSEIELLSATKVGDV